MLRAILVGLLAISAAPACGGGGSDAPKVEPGAPVGKVIEISGKVTATRGTQTRPLEANAQVSGDDVIDTGAEGRITILLAHNNAKWDLGPNKHEQVSGSLAWSAPKAAGPAGTVDETTTAGGRHAERQAATGEAAASRERRETEAAATEAPAAPMAPSGGAAAPGGPPAEDPKPDPGPERTAPPSKGAVPRPATATPPPPPSTSGSAGEGGGGGTPPPSKVKAKSATRGLENAKASNNEFDGLSGANGITPGGGGGTIGQGKGVAVGDKLGVDGGGSSSYAAAKTAVDRHTAELRACVAAAGKDKLTFVFIVESGKTSGAVEAGTSAENACAAKVAATIRLTLDQPAKYVVTVAK